MEQILDQGLHEAKQSTVKYAGFWLRLGALLIDLIVLLPLTLGVTWLNIATWKSPEVFVLVTLVSLIYKPFMEFYYGATLGKMVVEIRVVNLELAKAGLREILLRNVFHLVPSMITLVLTVSVYNLPEFESISGYGEYSRLVSASGVISAVNLLSALITIIDTVVLLADKQSRAWHDKIGGTFVIEKVKG